MLLGELIDECIYDVAFEAHRNIKQANSICQICQTRSVSLSIECYLNVLIPFLGVDLMVRERKRMLWMKDVDFMQYPSQDVMFSAIHMQPTIFHLMNVSIVTK